MKPTLCLSSVCLLLALPAAAETAVSTAISYEAGNPTNQLLLTWESIPTKQYRILTTTALGQPWQTLTNTPLVAENNLVRFRTRADATARFYRVAKLDTEPPEIWRLDPSSNAIAVPRQSQLRIYLNEETGLATNSIALTVGTNLPVTLADPRLALAGKVLTYTPATNQFLGANGQTITNKLIIADTLGNRATNTWPFKLEIASVLAGNVLLVGAGSPLTLVSTNGGTFVFSYTGTTSGLTNGQILVSTDTSFLFKIKVLSLTDNPVNHTVSVSATQAGLAECFLNGSARLTALAADIVPGAGSRTKDGGGLTLPLDGKVIYDNGMIKVQVLSGQVVFDPDFTVSGEFQNGRLVSFGSAISATLKFDMTVQGSFQVAGTWQGSKSLIDSNDPRYHSVKFIGMAGPVPIWVESVLELNLGYEAQAEANGSATAGFESSRSITYGAQLRDGQWTSYAQQSASLVAFPPTWQIGASGRLRGYVQPKLTIYLESLAGTVGDLRPYLELEGNACVQPGQAGADLSLYAGLDSTLAIDVRGWDSAWGTLPSWELFTLRGLIWHKNLSTPGGSPPTVAGNLAWIPCGTFTMGSPTSEPARYSDEVQHRVTISQGFWMGKYEVTQSEYSAVMGSNPSYFQGGNLPVEQVTWYEAVAYCTALTARERSAGRLPSGYVYRLPTESEWEYACRAGTTTAFHYGAALRSGMANFYGFCEYPPCGTDTYYCYNPSGTYLGRTTSVGSYAPDAWGLYDMHGNVWEWCQDWYGAYPSGSVSDPQGAPSGSGRVIRGGGWNGGAYFCRSAVRSIFIPTYRDSYFGFRVVLAPGQP